MIVRFAILALLALPLAADPPVRILTGPKQPEAGPGGKRYVHDAVAVGKHGEGNHAYWLFRPKGEVKGKLPVVVFLHGWNAIEPLTYRAWIDHLVKQGRIVIYPAYQKDPQVSAKTFTANMMVAVKAAFARLGDAADRGRWAITGHSAGGMLTANLAALAAGAGLTPPGAAMPVQPGVEGWIPYADLTRIPKTMLLLTISGDKDGVVGDKAAKSIIARATSIPAANRNHLHFRSDRRGAPALVADHYSPGALIEDAIIRGQRVSWKMSINALDYHGYWKLFDALCDAAFYEGKNRRFALGNTPEQCSLGRWSDGTPIRQCVCHVPGMKTAPPTKTVEPPVKPAKQAGPPDRPNFDLGYGPAERQRCDVYPPIKGTPKGAPLLLFVHGGAWKAGDKKAARPLGTSYGAAGLGVCAINYRLTPKVKHPEHTRDLARAIAWVLDAKRRDFWTARGIDPTKLVLSGHSAGGHMVALAALDARYLGAFGLKPQCIRGVVPFSGAYYLPSYHQHPGWQGRVAAEVFGGADALRAASPAVYASKSAPPFLIVHGEADKVVDVFQADFLHSVLRRQGARSSRRIVPGGNHGTVIMNTLKPGPAREALLGFIRKVTRPAR